MPITSTSPASAYWGIDQDVTYGSSGTSLLSGSAGIVDTGTTLLLLATDAFKAYQRATGAKLDQSTGLLSLTEAQFKKLQSLFFTIGGTTFEFTANAQIWPRALNETIGGEEGKIYLVTADLGSESGQGLDFISECAQCSGLAPGEEVISVLTATAQTALRSCSASTACTTRATPRSGSRPRSSRTPRPTERELRGRHHDYLQT